MFCCRRYYCVLLFTFLRMRRNAFRLSLTRPIRILYARRRPPIIEVIRRVHRVIRHSSARYAVTLENNFLHDCGLCPVISRRSLGARATDVYDYEITRFNFRRDTRRAQDTHIQATLKLCT